MYQYHVLAAFILKLNQIVYVQIYKPKCEKLPNIKFIKHIPTQQKKKDKKVNTKIRVL
jgi:hypothetical protein